MLPVRSAGLRLSHASNFHIINIPPKVLTRQFDINGTDAV